MTRADRIHAALKAAEKAGEVEGYYSQTNMPGRRWRVWGTIVGAHEYADKPHMLPMSCDRTYSTREIESVLTRGGYLS